ncbi:MAG: RNase P subunit p30 family protein [archaeon]|nr:RNase P subunit p30 family protein [archaeon]
MNLNLYFYDSIEEISALSKEFGDDAVIVARDFSEPELREFNQKKRKSKTKILSCKLFKIPDSKNVQKFRGLADLIAADGNSMQMNQWAAKQKVNLLLNPFSSEKPFFDFATANVLSQSGVATAICFSQFLGKNEFRNTFRNAFENAQLVKNATACVQFLSKANAPMLFVCGARDKGEARAAKDLSSFGVFLGMKQDAALKANRKNPSLLLEGLG